MFYLRFSEMLIRTHVALLNRRRIQKKEVGELKKPVRGVAERVVMLKNRVAQNFSVVPKIAVTHCLSREVVLNMLPTGRRGNV